MLIGFNNNRFNTQLAIAMIFILCCLWFGGIVQHYCLDGMEPDISLHFENLNGHIEHDAESGHNDFETKALKDNLSPKSYELGIQLFSLLLIILTQLKPASVRHFQLQHFGSASSSQSLRPPLRAPPAYS